MTLQEFAHIGNDFFALSQLKSAKRSGKMFLIELIRKLSR